MKKNVNWIKFKSVFIENSNEFKIIQWFLAKNQILVNIFLVMQTTNQTEGCCCLFSKFHHLNGTHFIIAEHIYHAFIWKTQELAQLINCTSFFTYSYQYLPRSLFTMFTNCDCLAISIFGKVLIGAFEIKQLSEMFFFLCWVTNLIKPFCFKSTLFQTFYRL